MVSAALVGAKFSGKRELYRFCASEVKMYVDEYEHMTIFHLRDMVSNKKKRILAVAVKHINVPHYEGLSIKDVLDWAK